MLHQPDSNHASSKNYTEASMQMVTTEHTEESKVMKWFNNNGLDIKNLPPFRYYTPLLNDERNKVF